MKDWQFCAAEAIMWPLAVAFALLLAAVAFFVVSDTEWGTVAVDIWTRLVSDGMVLLTAPEDVICRP